MIANILAAFSAGVVSFFAPCVVPLLPAYVSYVTGVSLGELERNGYGPYRFRILVSSLLYILGFSLVFVILGTAAGGLGTVLRGNSLIIQRIGGLLIIIFGLEFAGFINLGFIAREHKIDISRLQLGSLRSFIVGVVFALAWTPCVGVVLGSILALAAVSSTALNGAFLLFVYSLGIAIPFVIVALTLSQAPRYIKSFNRYVPFFSRVAGLLLAILGLLLLTNTYQHLNSWLFSIAFRLGYQIR